MNSARTLAVSGVWLPELNVDESYIDRSPCPLIWIESFPTCHPFFVNQLVSDDYRLHDRNWIFDSVSAFWRTMRSLKSD